MKALKDYMGEQFINAPSDLLFLSDKRINVSGGLSPSLQATGGTNQACKLNAKLSSRFNVLLFEK